MSLPPGIPPGTDLWAVPAGTPPPGSDIESNLANPPTNKHIVHVTLSVLLIVATIFVVLRIYVQMYITRTKLKWDDACIIAALPMQIAYTGIIMWLAEFGMIARHVWDIPLAIPLLELPYWTRVINSMPQPITGFIKVALLLFYLRIFGPDPTIRTITIIGIVFVASVYLAFTVTFAVLPSVNNPVVISLSLAQAAINVATDAFLFILPISGIIKLKIPLNRKIGIMCVFSTGLAAVLMSCLTLYWRDTTPRGPNNDSTWSAATIFTVSVAEIDVGIVCACMPLLAPLLPKISGLARGWTAFIRSQLRTTRKSQSTDSEQSNTRYDYGSDSSQKRNNYLELSERSEVKLETKKSSKKNWFDRSIMGVSAATTEDNEGEPLDDGTRTRSMA